MWRVELEGERYDLDDLTRAFSPSGDCTVLVDDGAYYLRGPAIHADDVASVRDLAKRIIAAANAGSRVADPGFRPVRVGAVVDPHGHRHVAAEIEAIALRTRVSIAGTLEVRDSFGRLVPPQAQPRSSAELMVELAALCGPVGEVVELVLGRCEFVELYKILEIVERDRGDKKVNELGWLSKEERARFTGSANHPGASGALARHARAKNDAPPTKTMTLAEARAAMFAVVDAWLRALTVEHGLPLSRPIGDAHHEA